MIVSLANFASGLPSRTVVIQVPSKTSYIYYRKVPSPDRFFSVSCWNALGELSWEKNSLMRKQYRPFFYISSLHLHNTINDYWGICLVWTMIQYSIISNKKLHERKNETVWFLSPPVACTKQEETGPVSHLKAMFMWFSVMAQWLLYRTDKYRKEGDEHLNCPYETNKAMQISWKVMIKSFII